MAQIKTQASADKLRMRDSPDDLSAASRTLRGIALFEAAKGLLVLLGGIGLFELIHRDVQQIAEQLIAHTHLNPANGYPRIFLDFAGKVTDGKLFALASLALAYTLIRLTEAYGLWFERRWAQWLAAVSGGIYVPIEIYELVHQASTIKFIALVANLAIVAFLGWRLARQNSAVDSIQKINLTRLMNNSVNAQFLHWTRHIRFRPRLASAMIIATLLFVYLSTFLSTSHALLLAFNGGAALFLITIAITMVHATPDHMRQQAKLQDEGKWTVLALSLAVSGVTLIALYLELHGAKIHLLSDVILASASILLSWLFVATMFALHYAHSFYIEPEPALGRLIFPGTTTPDYWDFMYFSIVLSTACQVSDVQIVDRVMRRTALLHGVVAFFFNVVIIAISVNVVAGSI